MDTLRGPATQSIIKAMGTIAWIAASIGAITFTRLPAHLCLATAAIGMCLSMWVETRESSLSRASIEAANLVALTLILHEFVVPMLQAGKPVPSDWIMLVFRILGSNTTVEVCAGLATLVALAGRAVSVVHAYRPASI